MSTPLPSRSDSMVTHRTRLRIGFCALCFYFSIEMLPLNALFLQKIL